MSRHWRLFGILAGLLLLVLCCFLIRAIVRPSSYSPDFHDPDPAVRADAVRHASLPRDAQLILERLHDDNADVRILAIWRVNDTRALVPLLIDPHAGVRQQAIEKIGGMGDWPAIHDALGDSNPRIREAAVRSISFGFRHKAPVDRCWPYQRAAEVLPVLEKLARDDPDPEVRRLAKKQHARITADLKR